MAKKPRFQRIRKLASRGKNYGRDVVNADQIQSEWGNIKDMASSVLKPKNGTAREETFDNAVNRLNLKESDLASAYKFHVARLYIFGVGLCIGIASAFAFMFTGSWVTAIACLGFSVAMAALTFQSSFRAFQISKRELIEVNFWLQHPGQWIPTSLALPKTKRSSNLPAKQSGKSRTPRQ
jgi:hypothetical protein